MELFVLLIVVTFGFQVRVTKDLPRLTLLKQKNNVTLLFKFSNGSPSYLDSNLQL